VTGLGTCDSDVDVTVLLPSPGVDDGGIEVAHAALHAAADNDSRFAPHRVVGGKCPVLTLEHLPTRSRVEVSVNNRLALRNTALQQAYFALNPVVAPLVHMARAWLDMQKRVKMSAYATTLAVIAYLQSVGALPNLQNRRIGCCCFDGDVHSLGGDASASITTERDGVDADDCDDESKQPAKRRRVAATSAAVNNAVVDGWDTSFCACGAAAAPHVSMHTASVELVAGWFDFLAARCSGDVAVSVRCDGMAMRAALQCECTGLTVEDPFELTHNVSRSVTDGQASALAKAAVRAAHVCFVNGVWAVGCGAAD
jgi:hypothetical protein